MVILILSLVISYILDVLVYYRFWHKRRILVPIATVFGVFAAAGVCFWRLNPVSIALAIVGVYRFINHIILVDGRGHDDFIKSRTLQTVKIFAIVQGMLIVAWALDDWTTSATMIHVGAIVGAATVTVAGLIVVSSVIKAWFATKFSVVTKHTKTKDLPTVTLAIPARNETDVLEQTIKAALASDYPKLEILVVDDCSQDQTADIIKGFAHDGVRFIPGSAIPNNHWVHKNYACQQLLEHASGQYILFTGVDIVLSTHSISQMVAYGMEHKLAMLSVLPARDASVGHSPLQTIRYWWELALPRDAIRRPPALSSCWMAETKKLKKLGGFEAVSRMVVPEAFFAREFGAKKTYKMVRGSLGLGITSRKLLGDQFSTAVRVRYPQLRRRPELVLLLSLLWLSFWVLPLMGIWLEGGAIEPTTLLLAVIGWALYCISYLLVCLFYDPKALPLILLVSPLLPLIDLVLIHISLFRYEFGTVEWKGRNVCKPVMHVYKSLPRID